MHLRGCGSGSNDGIEVPGCPYTTHTHTATLRNVIWAPAHTLESLEILHDEKPKTAPEL